MIFTFKNELKKGKFGEGVFLKSFDKWVCNTLDNVKNVDFIHSETKETLELKTDFTNYTNIFLEEDNDVVTGTKGGVVQAYRQGSKFYVIYFIKRNEWHWFLTEELFNRYEQIKNNYPLKTITNISHTGTGYAIPISSLEDLEIEPYN